MNNMTGQTRDYAEHEAASQIVAAVDIGTTKVCALIGRKNDLNQVEIMGIGFEVSDGVQRGVVHNIDKTVKAVREAMKKAQRMARVEVSEVSVGLAGQHVASKQNYSMITRDDAMSEITQEDLDALITSMRKLPLKPGEEILHIIPQDYCVDDEWGVSEPIGMCGARLGANFHIVTCQNTASRNLIRCIERAELRPVDLALEPIASAASVLSEEDRRLGVALVDIGGGTTDITIICNDVITHTCVLPFGGDIITRDISEGFNLRPEDAEKLKTEHGLALENEANPNCFIRISNNHSGRDYEICQADLASVIQARMTEIIGCINYQIKAAGLSNKLHSGIVLTGGGSMLKHVSSLTEFITAIPTRIGLPTRYLAQGYHEKLSSPIFATSIGLIVRGLKLHPNDAPSTLMQNVIQVVPTRQIPTLGINQQTKEHKTQQSKESAQAETPELQALVAAHDGQATPQSGPLGRLQQLKSTFLTSVKEWFEPSEDPDLQ